MSAPSAALPISVESLVNISASPISDISIVRSGYLARKVSIAVASKLVVE